MNRYQVIITPFAADNIHEVHARLMAENPVYAAKWLDGIRKEILDLEIIPESHAVAPHTFSKRDVGLTLEQKSRNPLPHGGDM